MLYDKLDNDESAGRRGTLEALGFLNETVPTVCVRVCVCVVFFF